MCASVSTRWRASSSSPTGWATQTMRAGIGCSSTAIWARSMSGSRGRRAAAGHSAVGASALTADLSAGATEALLRRLLDVQSERERAKRPQQLHAELRVGWQREDELLEGLTALLDDAQRALCEALPSLPGPDARGGRW